MGVEIVGCHRCGRDHAPGMCEIPSVKKQERIVKAALAFASAKLAAREQFIEHGYVPPAFVNKVDKTTDDLITAAHALGENVSSSTAVMYTHVLTRLTRYAKRVTLGETGMREVDARDVIAGLNLLNGSEQEAIETWLKNGK